MHIYKELLFEGDKIALDSFKRTAPSLIKQDWKCPKTDIMMADYIVFDYIGDKVDQAEVSIYYGRDSWRDGYIKVTNIVPLVKDQLSVEEYNAVLDLFYEEIIIPNESKLTGIKIVGPESDEFNPLKYISEEALNKLMRFCKYANKTTGSIHPNDEERWFDFICQTVDDNQMFDFDTLFHFLMDEDYWGKKPSDFIGAMGLYAWDEELAGELATEYDNYVRILTFYKEKLERKIYGSGIVEENAIKTLKRDDFDSCQERLWIMQDFLKRKIVEEEEKLK